MRLRIPAAPLHLLNPLRERPSSLGTGALHFCHPVVGESAFQERLAEIVASQGRHFRAALVYTSASAIAPERCCVVHADFGEVGCLPLAEHPDLRRLLIAQGPLLVTAQVYGQRGRHGIWQACDLLPCAARRRPRLF